MSDKEKEMESPDEDKKETKAEDKAEDSSNGEGVKLPEEFQKKVHSVIEGMCDTDEKCDYVMSCVSAKRSELAKKKQKTSGKPANSLEFSADSEY